VDDARFPRPEIVLALDAQLINLMNTLAPGVMDGVLGLALPFIEGMRGGVPPPPPAIRR
jgi:hypothetical protein